MNLTINPYDCSRGCKNCYLKPTKGDREEFNRSLRKLLTTHKFNTTTLFFNKPTVREDIKIFEHLKNTIDVSSIYVSARDFLDNLGILLIDTKATLYISKVFETDFERCIKHALKYTGAVSIVHMIDDKLMDNLDDIFTQIEACPTHFRHYVLFQKPFKIKDILHKIEQLIDYGMLNADIDIQYDQCVELATGMKKISEKEDGIEGRIDLHPDGKISFCPYFGKRYDLSVLTDHTISREVCICNKCPFL